MRLGIHAAEAALSAWEAARNEPPEDFECAEIYDAHITVFRSGKMIKHYKEELDSDESLEVPLLARSHWASTPNGKKWRGSKVAELPVKERHFFTYLNNGWQFERAQCGGIKVTVRYEPVEREYALDVDFEPSDSWKEAHGY